MHLDHGIRINSACEASQTSRRRRTRPGLTRAHWAWNKTRARRTRPSSHARRQGLGSPRAIGIHMRRPRLRKCSLSFLLSLYLSRTSSPSIHVRQFAISVANSHQIDCVRFLYANIFTVKQSPFVVRS